MTKEKVLIVRKILQQQYNSGKITKKTYKKELNWITKNILSNDLHQPQK
jgi:hypothetical protein